MTERGYTEQTVSTMKSLLEEYKTSIKIYVNELWKPTQARLCNKSSQRKASAITIPDILGLFSLGTQRERFLESKINIYTQDRTRGSTQSVQIWDSSHGHSNKRFSSYFA